MTWGVVVDSDLILLYSDFRININYSIFYELTTKQLLFVLRQVTIY